jgi:hypothetical protein
MIGQTIAAISSPISLNVMTAVNWSIREHFESIITMTNLDYFFLLLLKNSLRHSGLQKIEEQRPACLSVILFFFEEKKLHI